MDNVLPFMPRLRERQRRGSNHPAGMALRWRTQYGRQSHRIDPATGRTCCGIDRPLVITADEGLPECARCP